MRAELCIFGLICVQGAGSTDQSAKDLAFMDWGG